MLWRVGATTSFELLGDLVVLTKLVQPSRQTHSTTSKQVSSLPHHRTDRMAHAVDPECLIDLAQGPEEGQAQIRAMCRRLLPGWAELADADMKVGRACASHPPFPWPDPCTPPSRPPTATPRHRAATPLPPPLTTNADGQDLWRHQQPAGQGQPLQRAPSARRGQGVWGQDGAAHRPGAGAADAAAPQLGRVRGKGQRTAWASDGSWHWLGVLVKADPPSRDASGQGKRKCGWDGMPGPLVCLLFLSSVLEGLLSTCCLAWLACRAAGGGGVWQRESRGVHARLHAGAAGAWGRRRAHLPVWSGALVEAGTCACFCL